MSVKTILLKFAGPLQSWGTDSHFETRRTDLYPSKSGVTGFIAASLGCRRNDDEMLEKIRNFYFGVRIDQPGHIAYDYQTAHSHKPNGEPKRTYVTQRYYLEDAVFVVAISSKDEELMLKIRSGLKHPYFQTYLGRRSAPPTADFYLKETDQGLVESLKEEDWQASDWYKKRVNYQADLPIYCDGELLEKGQMLNRYDEALSFSSKDRKYKFRQEGRVYIHVEDKHIGEHDAFGALGG